jgi:hypothetical protein
VQQFAKLVQLEKELAAQQVQAVTRGNLVRSNSAKAPPRGAARAGS